MHGPVLLVYRSRSDQKQKDFNVYVGKEEERKRTEAGKSEWEERKARTEKKNGGLSTVALAGHNWQVQVASGWSINWIQMPEAIQEEVNWFFKALSQYLYMYICTTDKATKLKY